jgi:hypothetical protein
MSTLSLTWEQPHDRTTPSSSSPAVRFGTAALPIRRSTTPALNTAYVGNICFNCGKLGYCLSDCLLPCASRAELKKLKELLKSDSEDDEHLTDKTGKDTL